MRTLAALGFLTIGGCARDNGGDGQSVACKRYIECFEHTGGIKGSLDGRYGASGTCWLTPESTALCEHDCDDRLRQRILQGFADAGCSF